jgi:hypothetical protein
MRSDDPWNALDPDEEDEGSGGKGLLSALGIILLGLVLGGASGYAYWHFTAPKVEATSSPSTSSATPTTTSSATPHTTATGTPHAFAGQRGPEVRVEMPGAF